MRNVVMAAMLVAAGVSSSYVNRTGGSDSPSEAVANGSKVMATEEHLPAPVDDPMELLKYFLNPNYRPPDQVSPCADPIDRLRDLLSSNRQPCSAAPAAPAIASENNCAGEFKGANLNFMIATVPDPEQTHLGLDFDRLLEAVIFAAEEGGFSYHQHWLPWHVNHEAGNPDPLKQDILDGRGESRHRKPGIVIFRKQAETSESNVALVVYLVGETPTSGINRYQFQRAVADIRSFPAPCGHSLGIAGPIFSGSSASLRGALLDDLKPEERHLIPVISGGVSSLSATAGLSVTDAQASTTIHSDDFMNRALAIFCDTQLRITGKVVILREADTDFGANFLRAIKPRERIGANDTDIYYPREIYRLRNVYPEQINSAATQLANLQQQLSLHLRDSRANEDTPPEFSDQTPLTQETVLLQISETLRRDHVGLVVLTGTDVLDLLFLSRHLHQLSPDVRLMLWDSDLLFVHGTDTLDYSGMLAMSTYPLIPATHNWTRSPRPHFFFPSGLAEGVYNAFRLVLNPNADLRDYSSPQGVRWNARWPPVWLSIIGDDAYWPLGIVDKPGEDPAMQGAVPGSPEQLDPGWPTRGWSSFFYCSNLLALLYIGVYVVVCLMNPIGLPRWCSFLHPLPDHALRWRAAYSFLLSLALLLAYLCILTPVFRLGYANHHSMWLPMVVMGSAVFFLFLGVLALGGMLTSRGVVISAAASGLGLAAFFVYSLYAGSFFNEESFFRALRSVQLGSSVSPALPLLFLLLSFAWWCSMQIQRARLDVEQRVRIPNIAANGAWSNSVLIDRWLAQPFLHIDGIGWIVAFVGALVAGAVALPHIISVDGWLYDATVCTLLIPLWALISLTTYAFARVWRALNRLLEALESEPLRFAFSNLPSDVSWTPLWISGARRKSYTTLIRSLESLRKLEEIDSTYYPALSADILALEGHLNTILAFVHEGRDEPVQEIRKTQSRLFRIVKRLSAVDDTIKWNKSHSESLEKLKKATGGATVHKGLANWFHPRKPLDLKITSACEDADPEDKAQMLAAEVIALRYLAYIRYVMRHLRNLLSFSTTGFILMTLALNCYPFQTLNLIRWSITTVFVGSAAVLLNALQQMSHNEILRRVSDTPAGAVDTGLYTRAIAVGALPLLAVVASHFPAVGRFLFSWVQPAIAALH
jgi:hypothetical protein